VRNKDQVASFNEIKSKEEILNLIRNSDILSTTIRRVTTVTDTFTATAGQTDFTLTNEGVKNIRSLKINDVLKDLYKDYDINIMESTADNSKLVTLNVGASAGEEVKIEYDYSSSGDKYYPDFPDDHLTIKSFPRIHFDFLSTAYTNISCNDSTQGLNILIEFGVIALNKEINNYERQLYDLIRTNKKNLYWFNLLRPSGRSAKESYRKVQGNLLFSKVFNFTAPLEYETE